MQSACLRYKLPLLDRTEYEYNDNDNDNDDIFDNSLYDIVLLINVTCLDSSLQLHFAGSSHQLLHRN